jgi:hypothetical protein
MKALVQTIAFCAALLPLSEVRAATKFGEFFAGQTFNMKVATVSEIGKLPSTLPKFKKGQIVRFTIGAQGQLMGQSATGPTFSINFKSFKKSPTGFAHYFDNKTPTTTTPVHQAIVKTIGLTNFTPRVGSVDLVLRQQVGITAYQATYTFN